DGRTTQSSLLVLVPIKPSSSLETLQKLLGDIANPPGGEDLEVNPIIPFRKLGTVHFARILIHHASPSEEAPIPTWNGKEQVSGPPIPAKLLISTDFDGPLTDHLDELLREAGPGLDLLFAYCESWPGHARRDAAHQFFLRHRIASNTFYTGTMNRSVSQIRREAELREHIDQYLDAYAGTSGFPGDPVQIRRRVVDDVFANKAFEWTKQTPGPYPSPILPSSLASSSGLALGLALGVVGIVLAFTLIFIPPLGLALVFALAAL